MCSALAYVRFTPESDIKRDIWECPLGANSGHGLFHHFVNSREKRRGYSQAENPSRLGIDNQF